MIDSQRLHPPSAPETGGGYDKSRVHVAGTFWFLLGFVVCMIMILGSVRYFQRFLTGAPGIPSSPVIARTSPMLAQPLQPSPLHPTLPWQDMAALRAAQEAQLHSMGPLPGNGGHTHIPIDQAIDALVGSGALTRPWQNPATFPYQRPPTDATLPSVENRT